MGVYIFSGRLRQRRVVTPLVVGAMHIRLPPATSSCTLNICVCINQHAELLHARPMALCSYCLSGIRWTVYMTRGGADAHVVQMRCGVGVLGPVLPLKIKGKDDVRWNAACCSSNSGAWWKRQAGVPRHPGL